MGHACAHAIRRRRGTWSPLANGLGPMAPQWLDIHEQVQWSVGAPVGDLDGQRLLPAAQRRIVGNRPVEPGQLE